MNDSNNDIVETFSKLPLTTKDLKELYYFLNGALFN